MVKNGWNAGGGWVGRAIVIVGAIGAVAALPGCNIVGPAAYLIEGPPKIDRVHKLERKRPTVVFVDDRNSVLKRVSLRQTIAQAAQQRLLDEGVLDQVIDAKAAYLVVAGDKSGSITSIAEVGKSVGAEVVLYVTVDAFGLSPDGSTYAPAAAMRAKVLDVTKEEPRVWPEEREGFSFFASLRREARKMPESISEVAKAEDELAAQCGRAIAQLFHSHEARGAASRGK